MELRRILLGKTFLFLLAALVCLNGFFFLWLQADFSGDFRSYPEMYHTVVEECKISGLGPVIAFDEGAYDNIVADPTWGQRPENTLRLQAGEQVMAQYAHLESYADYLENIQTGAKKLQSVSIFGDPDSFAYKNTVKTAADFAPLLGAEVSFGHDLAVTKVFEDEWADYSCLLLMAAVCALFLSERKEGLWPMIHAASGGRGRLAVRRIGILFLAAWMSTLALFGSKILLSGWLYHGFGEWDRSVQSIPLFYNVPRAMTVGEFWGFYLVVKAMGNFLIGLILWTILSSISNTALAFCAAGLVLGAEFACTAILPSSLFAMLRYCNIFSFIRFFEVFSAYLNLPFFGLLISGSDLVLVLIPPLCMVFTITSVQIARKKHPVAPQNWLLRFADKQMRKLDPKLSGGSLFTQEAKKLLLLRGGALLLVAFLVVTWKIAPPDREYDPLDIYYQYYQDKYAGIITEDTINALQTELEKAVEPERYSALSQMIRDAERAPAGSWLVPTAPYEAVLSDNYGNYHRSTALIAMLFLGLLLSPIGSQERQSDMTVLLQSTSGGRKQLQKTNQLLLLLVTVFLWAVLVGAELYKTVGYWDSFTCFAAPMYSLPDFRNTGWSIPLGALLTLYYLAKLAVMLLIAEIVCFLSGKCSKNRDAILLSCGVLLIPAGLAAIGSGVGEWLSLLLPLGGSELLHILKEWMLLR